MDRANSLAKMEELDSEIELKTVEMHTGGEPLRIITSGFPTIQGDTVLQKRKYVKENLDHLRQVLMNEPRGHHEMYGALLVEPDLEQADMAVLFLHNEGYSTMCGHAVIALGRYAVDSGLVAVDTEAMGEIPVFIQCPCGIVKAFVEVCEGKTGRVRFVSVPAFAFALDLKVETEKFGTVTLDIGYGGAFYAIIDQEQLKMDLRSTRVKEITEAGSIITKAVANAVKLHHPDSDELAFLYGTIITDGKDHYDENSDECTFNVCIFADDQVDRSPTGSGVTARIAIQHAKKMISSNQLKVFQGLAGEKFGGKVVKETKCGTFDAVHVEVSGRAFYTGTATYTMEKDDPLKHGFMLH